jgi:hypothetical protein
MHTDGEHRLHKRAHQAPIQHQVEAEDQGMENLFDLVPWLLCLLRRSLLVHRAGALLSIHKKPPWLNFEKCFLLIVSPRSFFFFNSSSKFGMNHVSTQH